MKSLRVRTLFSIQLCIGSLFVSTAFADAAGKLRCFLITPDRLQVRKDAVISSSETSIDFQAPASDLRILGAFNSILNSTQVSIEDRKTGFKALSTDWSQPKNQKWSSSSVVFTLPNGDSYILQCNALLK